MTCKECLYYEVCPLGLVEKDKTGPCPEFKNKADYVEVMKVVEMLCKIKTAVIQNVSTMIENNFYEIVKDALGERRDA